MFLLIDATYLLSPDAEMTENCSMHNKILTGNDLWGRCVAAIYWGAACWILDVRYWMLDENGARRKAKDN